MPLSDEEVLRIARSRGREIVSVLEKGEQTERLLEDFTELVAGFSVWEEVRFWNIPEDDDHAPEDIVKTLTMRLAAELIKDHKVLASYPQFSFQHNKETKKIEKVGISYEFRPLLSKPVSGKES